MQDLGLEGQKQTRHSSCRRLRTRIRYNAGLRQRVQGQRLDRLCWFPQGGTWWIKWRIDWVSIWTRAVCWRSKIWSGHIWIGLRPGRFGGIRRHAKVPGCSPQEEFQKIAIGRKKYKLWRGPWGLFEIQIDRMINQGVMNKLPLSYSFLEGAGAIRIDHPAARSLPAGLIVAVVTIISETFFEVST